MGIKSEIAKRLPSGLWFPILGGRMRGRWWRWTKMHYIVNTGGLSDWGYVTGKYESWIQDLIASHITPGCWFLDMGAHHGFYSKLAGLLGAEVMACEGNPLCWPGLKANAPRAFLLDFYASATTRWTMVHRFDVVKCDIDGSEFEFLLGLFKTQHPKVIILSTHGPVMAALCHGLLEQHGYRLNILRPDDVVEAIHESA